MDFGVDSTAVRLQHVYNLHECGHGFEDELCQVTLTADMAAILLDVDRRRLRRFVESLSTQAKMEVIAHMPVDFYGWLTEVVNSREEITPGIPPLFQCEVALVDISFAIISVTSQ